MTTLLSEISISCVRAGCKVRLVSYGSKHASQSPSDKQFVWPYMHNLEIYRSHMNILHIEQLLRYQRHCSCALDLHERSDWRAMAPDKQQSFSDATLCAYTANQYTHCYLVSNYAWQQNSRALWLHTTHQMTALLTMMHCFIRAKLASYTTHCSVFN